MHTRAWRNYLLSDPAILIWMAVALIFIHCLVNSQYGFHREGLNFIEDGRHLAWGYVDCPPFTPFVAHTTEMLFGTSLVGVRFYPATSQGLALILAGLMVKRMRWGIAGHRSSLPEGLSSLACPYLRAAFSCTSPSTCFGVL